MYYFLFYCRSWSSKTSILWLCIFRFPIQHCCYLVFRTLFHDATASSMSTPITNRRSRQVTNTIALRTLLILRVSFCLIGLIYALAPRCANWSKRKRKWTRRASGAATARTARRRRTVAFHFRFHVVCRTRLPFFVLFVVERTEAYARMCCCWLSYALF